MSNAYYNGTDHIFYSDNSTDVNLKAPEGQNLIINASIAAVGNPTEVQFNDNGIIKGAADLNYNSGTGETILKKILLLENGNNFDNMTIKKGDTGLFVNDANFGIVTNGFESFRVDEQRVVNTSDLYSNNITGFKVNNELIYYAPDLYQSDNLLVIRYQGSSSVMGIKNGMIFLFNGGPSPRTTAIRPNGQIYMYTSLTTSFSYQKSLYDITNIVDSNVGKYISLSEGCDIFAFSNTSGYYGNSRINVFWWEYDDFVYKTTISDYDMNTCKVSGSQSDSIIISSDRTGLVRKFNWDAINNTYTPSQTLRATGGSTLSTYDVYNGTLVTCWDDTFRLWTQPTLASNFTEIFSEDTTIYGPILFVKAFKSVFVYTSARDIIITTRAGTLTTDLLVGKDEFILSEDITGITCNEKYVFVVTNTGIYTFYREKTNKFIQRDTKLLVAGPRSCDCTNNILTVGIPAANGNEGLNKTYQIDNITNSLVETTGLSLDTTTIDYNANQNIFIPVTGTNSTIKTSAGNSLNIDCTNIDTAIMTTNAIYPKYTDIELIGPTKITGDTTITGSATITGTTIGLNGITTNTGNFKVIGNGEITGTLTTTSVICDTAFKLIRRSATTTQSVGSLTSVRVLFGNSLLNEIPYLTITTVSGGTVFTCITKPLRLHVNWALRAAGAGTKPETALLCSNTTLYQGISHGSGSDVAVCSSCIIDLAIGDSFYINYYNNGSSTISDNSTFKASTIQIYSLL